MYNKRSLRFEFTNNNSSFEGLDGNNKISISNVRATVSCQSSGNLFGTQVNASIYGLGMDLLTALSSKAMGLYGSGTESISMEVYAEDTKIFSGFMTSSIANMNSVPNSALMITAAANADLQSKAVPPFSYNGAISAEKLLSAICKTAGYTAAMTGLGNITVTNPHYKGSLFEQLERVCYDFDIAMSVTHPQISFWPRNSKRDDVMPLVSAKYGLIGYPIFSNGGVMFQSQFSTYLTTGRNINLETIMPHASGVYNLSSVTHELSSWMPDGPWHSICYANRPVENN